jgi:hypothetical protein
MKDQNRVVIRLFQYGEEKGNYLIMTWNFTQQIIAIHGFPVLTKPAALSVKFTGQRPSSKIVVAHLVKKLSTFH